MSKRILEEVYWFQQASKPAGKACFAPWNVCFGRGASDDKAGEDEPLLVGTTLAYAS